MGQKTNPIGNRLGIIRGWDSNWFADKDFADKVVEDERIRRYLRPRVQTGGISSLIIERTLKRITITVTTSRPGIIIGKGGGEVESMRAELERLTGTEISINIVELLNLEMNATHFTQSNANKL